MKQVDIKIDDTSSTRFVIESPEKLVIFRQYLPEEVHSDHNLPNPKSDLDRSPR